MNLNKFYVLVDTEQKIVIDKIQRLPENWKNIAGLPGLTDEEICDLKWAGHHNLGWINIHSEMIKEYESLPENFELNKNTFKSLITDIREEKQAEYVNYHGFALSTNFESRYNLFLLLEKAKSNAELMFNYRGLFDYETFSSQQIIEMHGIIEEHIQKWFDWEKNVYDQINSCCSLSDFLKVNYDF